MVRSCVSLVLALLVGVARADEPPAPAPTAPAPWAVGLTPEREAAAKAALDEGNKLLVENDYVRALVKYREAIASWDHPAIRFNIVRCLIQLERYLEAEENLARALAYGAAPLEDHVYREAQSYQKLLAKQIGQIVVECNQAGAQLSLDGKPFGTCPVTETRRVEPGRHQILASQAGFITRTYDLNVVGGAPAERTHVALVALGSSTRVVHRWRPWVPWTVFGIGLAVTGIGGLVQLKAASDMDRFDEQGARCAGNGCQPGEIDHALESSARLENRIAIGVMSIGVATALTSGVLFYLNRGKVVEMRERVTVTPVAGGGVVGVTGRF